MRNDKFCNCLPFWAQKLFSLKLLCIACFIPSITWAAPYETLVFGPTSFENSRKKPTQYIRNFAVTGVTGVYFLRIQNGDLGVEALDSEISANNRVTSALVTLNGEQIVGPRGFNKQIHTLEIPVELRETNSLEAELRGEPGSGLTLSIIEKIDCPNDSCTPHTISPVLETQYKATSIIPVTGGSISTVAGNGTVITLVIPNGALAEQSKISLTPVSYISSLPLLGGIVSAVQFEPEGLLLAKPAKLTISLPDKTDSTELLGFGWFGAGEYFHLQPIAASDGEAVFTITHFSGAGAGFGGLENAKNAIAREIAKALEAGYLTLIVTEDRRLEKEGCASSACSEEELLALFQAKQESRENIFDDWLLALLDLSAESKDSNTLLVAALLSYNSFRGWAGIQASSYLMDGPVQAKLKTALSNLLVGAIAQFNRINGDGCTAQHDIEVLALLRVVVETLGAEDEFNLLLESRNIDFGSEYGCQLLIEVQGFPAEMVENGDEEDFSITLRHRVFDVPLSGVTGSIRTNRPDTKDSLINSSVHL